MDHSTAMPAPVITIDGPSGSGKGTVARRVAQRLNWVILDSGALYRLVAVAADEAGLPPDSQANIEAAAAMIPDLKIRFGSHTDGGECIELNGKEVTQTVRLEATGNLASQYASNPSVRAALLTLQHSFCQPPGLVADGRDMGTVVFPKAQAKFFITASVAERARRRVQQLSEMGIAANIDRIYSEIEARDERDRNRSESPLVPAADAVEIDTTSMNADQVLQCVLDAVAERLDI